MKRMGTSIAIIMVAMLLVVSCENPSSSAGDEPGTEITTTDTADIEGAFITVWKTTRANESIIIPINSEYTYNYDVDWGDGTIDSDLTTSEIHEYSNAGLHKVQITGTFPTICFKPNNSSLINDEENKNKLVTIKQWGNIHWETMSYAFHGCANVTLTATDTPDLSAVTDIGGMFSYALAFNGDLSKWDVSKVTDMESMFMEASAFKNHDLRAWKVSKVTEHTDFLTEAGEGNKEPVWQ